ncbi:Predicted arabinose efflux permease, MFS family [Pedococcus cremeus]|uniref:Predicted arabinose efflux permease, MFS family n=1 Tax=Pedococcus cremeus TaxID=587636 RepID=A0A1H9VY78_9MICO|nr:MFS transporter [Pedococcus cremeus]SES26451.1 Predicted arabinose efflux permease, MFS family [Pedococcus cremeus]
MSDASHPETRPETQPAPQPEMQPEMRTSARLRDDADFRRYWLARIASLTGSLITAVAMPVLIYRMTGSPFLTALTTTLEALPYLLIGLFAGALGDRWDRKRVMVRADLVNVVLIGSVPVAWWLGVLTVPHVLVSALLVQAFFTFFDGANFGALPVLVGRDRVGEANAAIWGFGGVLDLLVPATVGLALAVVHPADLLVVDALSYVASALAVRAIIRPLSSPREHAKPLSTTVLLADVAEGVRFLWRHPGVRSMTLIGMLQSIGGAGFMALVVVWCDRVLGIGTSGWRFGLLFSVWGIGGILASVVMPRLLRRTTPAALTLAAIPVSALAGLGVALARHWAVVTALMVVWGLAYQLVIIATLTYRQQETPEHLLSRVNTAGRMLSWGVGWTLGSLVAGALAEQVGARAAMVVLVSFVSAAAAFAWLSPLRGHATVRSEALG